MYHIEFSPGPLTNARVLVVGCGGTGGFVAEGLARLLEMDVQIMLADMDTVEPHNLRRQNFFQADLGKFKSQALAERLARQYGRRIGYFVEPFHQEMLFEGTRTFRYSGSNTLVIGCVDNPEARKEISTCVGGSLIGWWLDSGNGKDSGQVLIGNSTTSMLGHSFRGKSVIGLPAPHIQNPALLAPVEPKKRVQDCAQAVEADEQSPVINQVMASLVLQFVHLLFKGELGWMAGYVNMGSGTLKMVEASPESVAKLTGKPVKWLTSPPANLRKAVKRPQRVRVTV